MIKKMELLAPAGNVEKLKYAYLFGADAAYIGIGNFSLRSRADNFHNDDYKQAALVKPPGKKLYCVTNIYFHNEDLKRLEEKMETLSRYPFDAFIISDLGILPLMRKYFPGKELHLSTQANCTNLEAARMYKDLGFSRIVPGRELSLDEIAEIKAKVDIELEVFVHGAMCLAYSGRCYLSKYMANRSGNRGTCAHSCRWNYKLYMEEEERPGEFFPVYEEENYNLILSSKDICMIDHLEDLQKAGVDSLKIEGRMKSAYYTAVVARAYRKALDQLYGKKVHGLEEYKQEIYKVSHREFSTGFFYGKEEIEASTDKSYLREYEFLGFVDERIEPNLYKLKTKNQIREEDKIEFVGYDIVFVEDEGFVLFDNDMNRVEKVDHGKESFIHTEAPIKEGYLIRKRIRAQG